MNLLYVWTILHSHLLSPSSSILDSLSRMASFILSSSFILSTISFTEVLLFKAGSSSVSFREKWPNFRQILPDLVTKRFVYKFYQIWSLTLGVEFSGIEGFLAGTYGKRICEDFRWSKSAWGKMEAVKIPRGTSCQNHVVIAVNKMF